MMLFTKENIFFRYFKARYMLQCKIVIEGFILGNGSVCYSMNAVSTKARA